MDLESRTFNDTKMISAAEESVGFKITKIVFYLIILSCSTFGNSMVVYTICSSRRMRAAVSNLLILSLAVCDLLTPLVSIPLDFALEEHSYRWIYGPFLCKVLWPLSTLLSTSSSLTLAAISFDRYRNIMHPFRSRLTARQIKIIVPCVFLFSLLAVSPYMHVLRLNGKSCQEHWSQFAYRQSYTMFLFLVQYAIPLLFMSIMYTLALKNLHTTSLRTSRCRSPTVAKEQYMPKRRRVSLMPRVTRESGKELQMSPRPRRFSLPVNKRKNCTQETNAREMEKQENMLDCKAEDALVASSTVCRKYLHPEDGTKNHNSGHNTTRSRMVLRRLSTCFSMTDEQEKKNLRATKMFVAVVAVFALFMFPNQVVWLWADFGGGHKVAHFNQATIICWLFTYTNSVCNWIIYAYMNKDFRSGFKRIYRKIKRLTCASYIHERKISLHVSTEVGTRSTETNSEQ